ncbi:MAG: hypothetical protein WCI62_01495 [Erysipelotrichaceae bacterium]
MSRKSAVYERFFERVFKVFEVELVRLARMTQGSIIKRGRLYTSPTRESAALTKIEYVIDYETYGIIFTLIPNLKVENTPCCIVKMDYVLDPTNQALSVSLDEVMEPFDFTPFVYQDILSEELMLEVIETSMLILRKNQAYFKEVALDKTIQALIMNHILDDYHQLIGPLETLDESACQAVLDIKLAHAIEPFYKHFVLGNYQMALESSNKANLKWSAFDSRLLEFINQKLNEGQTQGSCLVPPLNEKNYRYVTAETFDLRKHQELISYGVAYVLTLLPMAILTYFVMGLSFWIFSFDSFYTTQVNTLISLFPLLIGSLFAVVWARSLAHQMIYPKDHVIYKGYAMKAKHNRVNRYLKLVSIIGILGMLSFASWGGTNIMIFNQGSFSLAPGFMWMPPTKTQTYYVVDHMEYHYTLTDESGKTITYKHYVLVFKDGKRVLLKPYLGVTECEDVLIPFMERRNIKTIR